MLTALFIQHDKGFHAHLVTLQHNNDVTIARQTNAARGGRAARALGRPSRRLNSIQLKLTTKQKVK